MVTFKKKLIEEVNKLIPNSEIFDSTNLHTLLENIKCIDVIYPGLGNNFDFINKLIAEKQITVNYIFREDDLINWNYSNSGFYKFKSTFYAINHINDVT